MATIILNFLFFCSFNDIDELRQAGLYMADMNGHGLSRELLLRGWQHLSRLELLFEKAESRSLSLEKSCRLLDEWKKKGDQLLYSCIPRSIAAQLRAGKSATAECWQEVLNLFEYLGRYTYLYCCCSGLSKNQYYIYSLQASILLIYGRKDLPT